jgi:hypothetical protein
VRWLADECIDAALVAHLRVANAGVLYMAETGPAIPAPWSATTLTALLTLLPNSITRSAK